MTWTDWPTAWTDWPTAWTDWPTAWTDLIGRFDRITLAGSQNCWLVISWPYCIGGLVYRNPKVPAD